MRWLGLALLIGGCNQIFDLRETRVVDASPQQFFDAMPDAPFACPPVGGAPAYSQVIRQVLVANCHFYSESAERAAAVCYSTSGPSQIRVGPIGGALTNATGITQPTSGMVFQTSRISPEGDRLYITAVDNTAMSVRLMSYAKNVDDTWSALPDPAITIAWNEFPQIIGVTRAPHPHLFLRQQFALREYVSDDAGSWSALPAYSQTDLGHLVYDGSSTSDGLRMLLQGPVPGTGELGVTFTDRADLTGRFRLATDVPTLPGQINDAFMDDACARVYFSGFGSIFYIQQQ